MASSAPRSLSLALAASESELLEKLKARTGPPRATSPNLDASSTYDDGLPSLWSPSASVASTPKHHSHGSRPRPRRSPPHHRTSKSAGPRRGHSASVLPASPATDLTKRSVATADSLFFDGSVSSASGRPKFKVGEDSLDVSFVTDNQSLDGDVIVPPTMIPQQYRVQSSDPVDVPPTHPDAMHERFLKSGHRAWAKTTFPSLHPSGRQEAVLLRRCLDKMLTDLEAKSEMLTPRGYVTAAQTIQSQCFFEVVRQVTVHCYDRGVLLKGVWEGYSQLFESLREATQMEVDAIRADADARVAKYKAQAEQSTALYEVEKRRADDLASRLRAAMQVGDRQSSTLKSSVSRMEATCQVYRGQLEHLNQKYEALDREYRMLRSKSELAEQTLMAELARLKSQNRLLERKAHDGDEALERLQLLMAQRRSRRRSMAVSEQSGKTRRAGLGVLASGRMSAGLGLLEEGEEEDADVSDSDEELSLVSVGTQTDSKWGKVKKGRKKPSRSPSPKKTSVRALTLGALKRNTTPHALTMAVRLCVSLMNGKIKADMHNDVANQPRQSVETFVVEWYRQRYGVESVVVESAAKLVKALKKHSSNPYCRRFSKFWAPSGLQVDAPMSPDETDFFLSTLSAVNAETTKMMAGLAAGGITPAQSYGQVAPDGTVPIPLSIAQTVLSSTFSSQLSSTEVQTLFGELEKLAKAPADSKASKSVDQEVFLSFCLSIRTDINQRAVTQLKEAFIAGDTNGDGVLSLGEFRMLLKHVKGGFMPEREIRMMYEECCQPGSQLIEVDDFVRVGLKHELLTVNITNRRVAAEGDEKTQAALLEEAWRETREQVMAKLPTVSHRALRATLTNRSQQLDKMVEDGKGSAGWMVLKMVLADLQAVDEDEVKRTTAPRKQLPRAALLSKILSLGRDLEDQTPSVEDAAHAGAGSGGGGGGDDGDEGDDGEGEGSVGGVLGELQGMASFESLNSDEMEAAMADMMDGGDDFATPAAEPHSPRTLPPPVSPAKSPTKPPPRAPSRSP